MMASNREADPIALSFLSQGFHAFVLRYSVGDFCTYPTPFIDASRAMQTIRDHANEWHLDRDKIAVCGFSAGGHLAASLGTMWNDPELIAAAGIREGENRPNALILGYPVITCQIETNTFMDTMWSKVIGNQPPVQMEDRLSCERHVGGHTPPTFLFHTFMDNVVPIENSLLFAQALTSQDIPFELHIYPNGQHGLSLANAITSSGQKEMEDTDVAGWFNLCSSWLWRLFGRPEATSKESDGTSTPRRAKMKRRTS
jgi:Esterase/lipase